MLTHLSEEDVRWLIEFLQSQKGRVTEKIDELYLEKLETHFELEEHRWAHVLDKHDEVSSREKELVHGVMTYVASTGGGNGAGGGREHLMQVTWKLIRTMYTTVFREEGKKGLDWAFGNYRKESAITAAHLFEKAGAGKSLEEGGDDEDMADDMAKVLARQVSEIIKLTGFSVAAVVMGLWASLAQAYDEANLLLEKSAKVLEKYGTTAEVHEGWLIDSMVAGQMLLLNLLNLEMLDADNKKITKEDLVDSIVKKKPKTEAEKNEAQTSQN